MTIVIFILLLGSLCLFAGIDVLYVSQGALNDAVSRISEATWIYKYYGQIHGMILLNQELFFTSSKYKCPQKLELKAMR